MLIAVVVVAVVVALVAVVAVTVVLVLGALPQQQPCSISARRVFRAEATHIN